MKKDVLSNKLIILTLISLLPTIILGILEVENQNLVWVCDALVIILSLFLLSFKKVKLNKTQGLVSILFILFIITQLISYIAPSQIQHVKNLYMVLPFLYFLHFLYSFILIENNVDERFNVEKYLNFFLTLVIVSCIYNIFKNYSMIFNIANITSRYVNISSFFSHRNAFGQFLFLGTISNVYLISKTKEKKYYISLGFILLNILFSFSRTAIFSTVIFLILSFVKIDIKKMKKGTFILYICGILLIPIILYGVINSEKIVYFLEYYVLRADDGITGRSTLWKVVFSVMTGYRWIIGYGLGSSSNVLQEFGLPNSHNTYIEMILTGGIINLLLYFIIYYIILKKINKIIDGKVKKILNAMYFSMLIYCIFEKVLLFSTGYAPFLFTIFMVALPNSILKKQNKIIEKENME